MFVHGGPATAVVRKPDGESVVLLSGELPEVLTDASVTELLDLAAPLADEDWREVTGLSVEDGVLKPRETPASALEA